MHCHFLCIFEVFRLNVLFGTVLPQTIIDSSDTGHTWSLAICIQKQLPKKPLYSLTGWNRLYTSVYPIPVLI